MYKLFGHTKYYPYICSVVSNEATSLKFKIMNANLKQQLEAKGAKAQEDGYTQTIEKIQGMDKTRIEKALAKTERALAKTEETPFDGNFQKNYRIGKIKAMKEYIESL